MSATASIMAAGVDGIAAMATNRPAKPTAMATVPTPQRPPPPRNPPTPLARGSQFYNLCLGVPRQRHVLPRLGRCRRTFAPPPFWRLRALLYLRYKERRGAFS